MHVDLAVANSGFDSCPRRFPCGGKQAADVSGRECFHCGGNGRQGHRFRSACGKTKTDKSVAKEIESNIQRETNFGELCNSPSKGAKPICKARTMYVRNSEHFYLAWMLHLPQASIGSVCGPAQGIAVLVPQPQSLHSIGIDCHNNLPTLWIYGNQQTQLEQNVHFIDIVRFLIEFHSTISIRLFCISQNYSLFGVQTR